MNLDEIRKARSRAVSQLGTHPFKNLVDKFFRIMETAVLRNEAQISWEAAFFGRGEVYTPLFSGGEFIGQLLNTGNRIGILSSNTYPGFSKYGLLKNESLPGSRDHIIVYRDGTILRLGAGSLFVLYSPQTPYQRARNNGQVNLLNGKLHDFLAGIN